ncbi:MAG: hypothetical protein FWC58_07590 [Desulfobulbus sp.]|nr:hypothetical protein [Desulfobulbus sp.]
MEISILAIAFGKSLLLALAAVLPILNPPAVAPVFVNLTRDLEPDVRRAMATRVGINVALMLAVAMLIGTYVLDFFGVSIPIVRVAGGLIVAFTAWGMLTAQQVASSEHSAMASLVDDERVRLQAFYPMAFPLTCGPGSISAAITVGAALHNPKWAITAANFAGGPDGHGDDWLPGAADLPLREPPPASAGRGRPGGVSAPVGLHPAVRGRADFLGGGERIAARVDRAVSRSRKDRRRQRAV